MPLHVWASVLVLALVAPLGPGVAAQTSTSAITPSTSWRSLDPATQLTRIAFGSCLDQKKPQPIWKAVLAARPQLVVMMGDNVYGDVTSAEMRELKEAYALQARHPELAEARAAVPFLATWDDHDYGLNDAGGDFRFKEQARALLHQFWQTEGEPRANGGIHYSRMFGPEGRRVQLIMLDTRSFRSPLRPKGPDFPHWGRYEPDNDPEKTILGPAQWAWLEAELRRPAELRLIVSSIQVVAEGHGYERWGNLPRERDRLLRLVRETGANGVVLFSGDRHSGALYKQANEGGYPLVELTTSSLNLPYGPSRDGPSPNRLSNMYHPENFGLLEIDWEKRELQVHLKAIDGARVAGLTVPFRELGMAP